ncbi:PTS-dependent dihydroxyacetone kinase phosphotransferase subunit DhaM [Streptomyces lonarensis]|uniref:PTS fructose transporter subunit IIA n=1 Tax=Streptomyces lonarensis TaxID=700599 RepID=A0A7X6HZZ5_9ACTN|nr:PTS fructose transporter subunit IIA [Streptomyces lonarensis]NJQ07153.1 PTS fructose transporter subunit IIA [Streptomyces lonarensis]
MSEPTGSGPVGVVLVSHSRDVADAVARLAVALGGGTGGRLVAAAGGAGDGGIGTSSELIVEAARRVDRGSGVVVVADLGSAVLTVRALVADEADDPAGGDDGRTGSNGDSTLPPGARLVDAPFLEGAVAAVVSAGAGAPLADVVRAAEDAYTYRKL